MKLSLGAALAAVGLVAGCAAPGPVVPAKDVRFMGSEAHASQCEVRSVVHAQLDPQLAQRFPADSIRKGYDRLKADGGKVGANFVHLDRFDQDHGEMTATAYSCPATFKNDRSTMAFEVVTSDGKSRMVDLMKGAQAKGKSLPK
jgi:hypothetical protein